MRTEGVSALLVAASQAWFGNSVSFGEVAREQGLATICEWDFMARAGCVFADGHDLLYARRRAGWYAARVMKGQAPADLPVEQPDAWKLTVNLLAARRVGITVPAPFLPVPMRSSNRAPARAFGPPAHRRGGAAALSRRGAGSESSSGASGAGCSGRVAEVLVTRPAKFESITD
jgi:hypothetical protein